MSRDAPSLYDDVKFILEQDYRGVKFGIYAVATIGLAAAIHRVRPVSKYSTATQVPSHFLRQNVALYGKVVSVEPAPLRILVSHRAPIYLPLWHSRKPPLPVQLWGVKLADGNAVGWLQCVAVGNNVVMRPVSKDKDNLVCNVEVHLKNKKTKNQEIVNLGQRLVELGFAKVEIETPQKVMKDSLESKYGAALVLAESKARSIRAGVWSSLPPPPIIVVILKQTSLKTAQALSSAVKLLLRGAWGLVKRSVSKDVKHVKNVV